MQPPEAHIARQDAQPAEAREELVAALVDEQRRTNELLETMCVLLLRNLYGGETLLTAKQLQQLIGIGKTKYHELVKDGHLKPQKLPDSDVNLYPLGTVEALLRRAHEIKNAV